MEDPVTTHELYIGFPPEDPAREEPPREEVLIKTRVEFGDECAICLSFRCPLDLGPEQIQEGHAKGLKMVDPTYFEDSRPLDVGLLLKYLRSYRSEHRANVLAGEYRGARLSLETDSSEES